jgi:type III pantothenate kinase
MQLALDIGNTLIKAALFENNTIIYSIRFKNWNDEKWMKLLAEPIIKEAIVCSVETHETERGLKLSQNISTLHLTHDIKLPIENNYKTPETLGKDRLAGAIGGWVISKGQSVLVIDAGTCIKYDFVDKNLGYMGGSITPGFQMRLDALNHYTARLPLIQIQETKDFYGDDTKSAILSGALTGIKGECLQFITQFEKRFGKINVILTGGNADFLSLLLNSKYLVEPDLVLIGLHSILNFNLNNDN